jgi:hypothetical protein
MPRPERPLASRSRRFYAEPWPARGGEAIEVYDGTEDQYVADWARQALRGLDERRTEGG